MLDHGWTPQAIDFERGEFDAVAAGADDKPLLVMEAKARVSGPDSLEKLLTSWLGMARDHAMDLNNNAGRKYRDLLKRCETGPVVVWLVAAGARWSLIAELMDGSVRFAPAADPTPELCRNPGGDNARVIPVRRAVPPSGVAGRRRRVLATRHRLLSRDAHHLLPGSQQQVAVRVPTRPRRTGCTR